MNFWPRSLSVSMAETRATTHGFNPKLSVTVTSILQSYMCRTKEDPSFIADFLYYRLLWYVL